MIDDPGRIPRTEDGRRFRTDWRRAYVVSAWTAGAFSVVVCGVMIWNTLMLRIADPLDSKELSNLKAALIEKPRDESLKLEIRKLDARLREEFFRRRALAQQGAWLVLAGVAALVLMLRSAVSQGKELPMPNSTEDRPHRERDPIRVALMAMGAVMIVSAVAVILPGQPRFLEDSVKAAPNHGQTAQPAAGGQRNPTDKPADAPAASAAALDPGQQWPRFRGPSGLGVAADWTPPANWDLKAGKGVVWTASIPLPGNNSPVVWGDAVFLTAATKSEHVVYCFDAATGKLRWTGKAPLCKVPMDEDHEPMEDTGYAAPTAATNGQQVVAIFADGVVTAFNTAGTQLWSRDFGLLENGYGHASSLAVEGDLVFVLLDQASADDKKSKLCALKLSDGTTAWETPRSVPQSWGSPATIEVGGQKQLVTVADPWIISYDPQSGKELWRSQVLSGEIAPSIAFDAPLVFACEPYSRLVAVKADGRGDLGEAVAWERDEGIPDISSPVAAKGLVFCVTSDGWLVCYDAQKGDKLWETELKLTLNASPIIAGDKLILVSSDGTVIVLRAGRELQELARSSLGLPEDELANGTPAIVGGKLYLRTTKRLFCLGAQ